MSALLQAIGKHVASAPEPMKKGAKASKPSMSEVSSSAPGDVPSENNQPQDLHSLHSNLKGLVPDALHEELGQAIAKHMSSKGA